jgi:LysR family transcriptional regulator, low CO2-responsive transcriptional regulator
MNYTIHQLKIFLKVLETKSITKTAEELYMTQPAISIQLKNFQDQFKIPLTEIHGRQLYVTDFGYEIGEIAKRVLENLEEIQFKTKAYQGVLTGKLKIATASTGKYVMPYFLSGFMNKYEGIDFNLDVTNKTKVIESLKNNEIDFALVSILPDELDVLHEELIENKLFLVGNSAEPAKNASLIYREKGSATRAEMEAFFKETELNSRKKLELTSNEAVKQSIIAGLGISIVPVIGIKNEIQNGSLHIIKRKGLPIVNTWRLIWLKNKKLSPVAEGYLQFIRNEKERIIQEYFAWYESY